MFMADSMSLEQQGEMLEGMFEWQIEEFEEKDNDGSPVFQFGRHSCILLLQKSGEGFNIVLQIIELCGKDIFSDLTYCKASVIGSEGNEFCYEFHDIQTEQPGFLVMDFLDKDHDVYSDDDDEQNVQEILTAGILTFRLEWSNCRNKLDYNQVEQMTHMPGDHLLTETDRMKLFNKMFKDIQALCSNKKNGDCVLLKVGDVQFPVHRAILSARSEVFAAMFRHDTIENRNDVVNIQDIEADVLHDILHYAYTGNLNRLTRNNAASMFSASDKYAMMEARAICLKILMHNLTMENVGDAIVLAHVHEESALKSEILEFIENNSSSLVKTNTWKELSKNKPYLAIEYLQSALITAAGKLKLEKRKHYFYNM